MKRFLIYADGELRGEGCEWTDGSADVRVWSRTRYGVASNYSSNLDEARQWINEVLFHGFPGKTDVIRFLDEQHHNAEPRKVGVKPSERIHEICMAKMVEYCGAEHLVEVGNEGWKAEYQHALVAFLDEQHDVRVSPEGETG